MIKFNFEDYMKKLNLDKYFEKIENIKDRLNSDLEMLDWYELDKCISKEELDSVKDTSKYIRNNCDIFIVIGIGGSFLGAKSVINALSPYFKKSNPEIIFVGTSLSSNYLNDLMEYVSGKDIILNVISKSGTTLEPSICFNILYNLMCDKYSPEELKRRIIITTDKKEGNLRKLANDKGYISFEVPKQIGGRYSVLTAVGLLPIAVSGLDVDMLFEGARNCNIDEAFKYAVIRDILYRDGKKCESFTVYEPKLDYFCEWLKQLFGETQGKRARGILPISSINTRDLHSLGQYYQEGERIIFETVISIRKTSYLYIRNYKKTLDEINTIAARKVAEAHYNGGTYSIFITMEELNEYNIGYLIYFFEVAAATGAYLLNSNPFDQPGVNAYKNLINKELSS